MSLDAAASISTILGLPLAAVPPVGLIIHSAIQHFRPKSKYKKWNIRIQQISAVIASIGDSDMISQDELDEFLGLLELYKEARDSFRQKIKDGTCTWYGKGRGLANNFSDFARDAWENGLYLSTEASARKLTRDSDQKARSNLPAKAQLEPSGSSSGVVQAPTTSTSPSPLDKGKSRQTSSFSELSEESPLKNEPQSEKSLDTAKSSEPSTGIMMSDSSSCLPNELPPSTSFPPLYSEAVNNGSISVNPEDDSEDDSSSESDSESNNLAPEEVEAVYNFWRQIPQERCPWSSTVSLLDKLRLRGVITRQKSQH